jgi:hypothetical protein
MLKRTTQVSANLKNSAQHLAHPAEIRIQL